MQINVKKNAKKKIKKAKMTIRSCKKMLFGVMSFAF